MSQIQRVLLLDDDAFARSVVGGLLERGGYEVQATTTVAEAIAALETFDPHVIITDLDLGDGPNGVDLIRQVTQDAPWIAIVILSSHRSPRLVDPTFSGSRDEFTYLVKSDLSSADQISDAIQSALEGSKLAIDPHGDVVILTTDQADVLRMISRGMTNEQIAQARGTGLRAAEAMIRRTLDALGLAGSDPAFARVPAARMYRESAIDIK